MQDNRSYKWINSRKKIQFIRVAFIVWLMMKVVPSEAVPTSNYTPCLDWGNNPTVTVATNTSVSNCSMADQSITFRSAGAFMSISMTNVSSKSSNILLIHSGSTVFKFRFQYGYVRRFHVTGDHNFLTVEKNLLAGSTVIIEGSVFETMDTTITRITSDVVLASATLLIINNNITSYTGRGVSIVMVDSDCSVTESSIIQVAHNRVVIIGNKTEVAANYFKLALVNLKSLTSLLNSTIITLENAFEIDTGEYYLLDSFIRLVYFNSTLDNATIQVSKNSIIWQLRCEVKSVEMYFIDAAAHFYGQIEASGNYVLVDAIHGGNLKYQVARAVSMKVAPSSSSVEIRGSLSITSNTFASTNKQLNSSGAKIAILQGFRVIVAPSSKLVVQNNVISKVNDTVELDGQVNDLFLVELLGAAVGDGLELLQWAIASICNNTIHQHTTLVALRNQATTKTLTVVGFKTISLTLRTGAVFDYSRNTIDMNVSWGETNLDLRAYKYVDPFNRKIMMEIGWLRGSGGVNISNQANLSISENILDMKSFLFETTNIYLMHMKVNTLIEHQSLFSISQNVVSTQHQRSTKTETRLVDLFNGYFTIANRSNFSLTRNRLVLDANLTHEAFVYGLIAKAIINVTDSEIRVEGNDVILNTEFPKYIAMVFTQFQESVALRSGILHFEGNTISLVGVVPDLGGVETYLEFLDQADSGSTARIVFMVEFSSSVLTLETSTISVTQVTSAVTITNSSLQIWTPSLPLPAVHAVLLHLNDGSMVTGSGSTCTLNVSSNVVEVHIASHCRINTSIKVALLTTTTSQTVSVAGAFYIEENYLNHTISDDPSILKLPCMVDLNTLEFITLTIRTMGSNPLRIMTNRNQMWGTYAPRVFDKVRAKLASVVLDSCAFPNHTYLTATQNLLSISHGQGAHQNTSTLVQDITSGNAFIFLAATAVSAESNTDAATYCIVTDNTITMPVTLFNWGTSSAFVGMVFSGGFSVPLGLPARVTGNRFTAVVGDLASIPWGISRSKIVAVRLQTLTSGSGGVKTLLEATGNTFKIEYFEAVAPSVYLSVTDRTTAFQSFVVDAMYTGATSLKICKNTMIAANRMSDPPQVGTRQIISYLDVNQTASVKAPINLTNCLFVTPTPTMSLTPSGTATLPTTTATATSIVTRSPTLRPPHSATSSRTISAPNNTATNTQQLQAKTTTTPSFNPTPSHSAIVVNLYGPTHTTTPLISSTTTQFLNDTTTSSTTKTTSPPQPVAPPLTCGALIATKNGKFNTECNGTASFHALWTSSFGGLSLSSTPINVTTSPPYIANSQAATFRSRIQNTSASTTTLEVCQAVASPLLLGEVGWKYWAGDNKKPVWVVLGSDDGPFAGADYQIITNSSDLVALNSKLQFTASHLHLDGTTEGTAAASDFYVRLEVPLHADSTTPPPLSIRHMRLVVSYTGDTKLNGFAVRVSVPTSTVLRCAGPSQLVVEMHLAPQKQLTDTAVIGEAVGGTVTIAGGIAGSSGSVVKGGMLASLSALLRCESPDLSSEVPLLQNTLGIRFGAELGQYQRGGIISGVIVLMIVAAALAVALIPSKMFALRQEYASHGSGGVSARRKHGDEPSWADAVRFSHFPGVLILAVAISGEAIVPSAATLVSMPNATGGDIVFGVVCLVVFFAYVAHVLVTVFRPPIVVRTVAKLKRSQQHSRPAAVFVFWFSSPAAIVPIGLDGADWITPTPELVSQLRSIVGHRKFMGSTGDANKNNGNDGDDDVNDDKKKKESNRRNNSSIAVGLTWFLRYAPYADELTLIPFKALELLAGSVVNLLDGVVTEHCFVKAIVLLVVISLLFVLILVKRPYAVPVQQIMSISLFGSMLLATVVVTVNLFKQHPTLDKAAEVLFVLASAFTVLQAVIDVTVSLVTVHVLLTAVWEWRRRAAAAAANGDDDDMPPIPKTLHQPVLQKEDTMMLDRGAHASPSSSAAASSPAQTLSRTHDVLLTPSTSSSSDDILPLQPHVANRPRRHTEVDMDFPEDEREVQRRLLAEMETWENEHPLL